MTKAVCAYSTIKKSRSAWASAQSDQQLYYSLLRKHNSKNAYYKQYNWADGFDVYLV